MVSYNKKISVTFWHKLEGLRQGNGRRWHLAGEESSWNTPVAPLLASAALVTSLAPTATRWPAFEETGAWSERDWCICCDPIEKYAWIWGDMEQGKRRLARKILIETDLLRSNVPLFNTNAGGTLRTCQQWSQEYKGQTHHSHGCYRDSTFTHGCYRGSTFTHVGLLRSKSLVRVGAICSLT